MHHPLLVALGAAVLIAPLGAQQPAEPWRIVRPAESSLVLARDGSLIGEIGKEWRTNVRLSSLPAYVAQAFIAVEDRRFYQHDGVDVVGIASALKDNLLGGSRGASTITQQLVGNMHPDIIDRSRPFDRPQAARAVRGARDGTALLEGADPRGVPEPDRLRSRMVRRRRGGATLLRQAGVAP